MLLRAVVDTAISGVIPIDARGCVLMFNPACERLLEYSADEVIGQNVKMLVPAPYRVEHDRYLDNFHQTGVRKIIDIGREVSASARTDRHSPWTSRRRGKTGRGIDLCRHHPRSDRAREDRGTARASTKNGNRGGSFRGIAHDFNNLLTVIVGNAKFLTDQLKARPDLRQLVDDIGRAGERGAELTQRLLAFSRRQTLRPVEIDCNSLLESMHKLLRRTMREDIEIKIDFDPDIPLAFADPA